MRIVKQNRFKNLGELHKEWTEAGVMASRATTHRWVKEFGYSCHIPLVKGIVHPKMKILSSFTHPQVVPNLYEFLCSAEHKGRYFEESL